MALAEFYLVIYPSKHADGGQAIIDEMEKAAEEAELILQKER